ncbi:VanZ family protein [Amycolatopsis roodepoortensis]|uniref:Glycopeptide antibiotics resistance protein n=1 Tax=Amycolatopsis roodepoortensis TaxID=700274 RepID=A0ABR9L8T3_9PSEU|nr:VanZ family protein [Amycolatopsis roodepoortensis]MBE1577096.1 glycopeptide antibiotics resistance protein [Amycolatopsis roodepoortensis]
MGWWWQAFFDAAPWSLLAAAAGAVVAEFVARRRGNRRRRYLIALDFALLASLFAVITVVFVPVPMAGHGSPVSLHLLGDVLPVFDDRPDVALFQLAGNVLLLAPLAVLAPMRFDWAKPVPRIVLAAFAMSVSIECLQVWQGAGRVGSLDDVLCNTAGAALAAWCGSRLRSRAAGSVRVWHRSGIEVRRPGAVNARRGQRLIGRVTLSDLPPLAEGATLEITLSESDGGALFVSAQAEVAA